MSNTLEVRVSLAECAGGCMRAADLALLLDAIERGIRAVAPAVALPHLAIASIDQHAQHFHLRMDAPDLDAPLTGHPLVDLVNAQAAGRDGLCLEALLPRRINSIELSCGSVRATACNRLSYDNWPKAAKELRTLRSERPTAARPYLPPPDDQLLNFDVEQFNREVAEARAAEQAPWWE